jgi:hypothetical protein
VKTNIARSFAQALLILLTSMTWTEASLAGGPYSYYTVAPCRLIDTRGAAGIPAAWGGPNIVGHASTDYTVPDRQFQGAGASHCFVPADAKAVAVTVTAVNYPANGRLTIYASDPTTRNATATLNYRMGDLIGNVGTIIALAPDGTFYVYSTQDTHLIVDVNGYYK